MHYFIFPLKDSTIYEDSVHQNCGMDQILELEKRLIHAQGDVPWNSRILIQFDLSDFSSSLASGELSGSDMRYYLNLYTDEAVEIPVSYTVYVYPVGILPATASLSASFTTIESGSSFIVSSGSTTFTYIASDSPPSDSSPIYYFLSGSAVSESIGNLVTEINNSAASASISASSTYSSPSSSILTLYANSGGTTANSFGFATGSGTTTQSFDGGLSNIGSWEMGVGKRGDNPVYKTGVSWDLRNGVTVSGITGSAWTTSGSDFISGSGYAASQSFDYQTTDLHVDVTTIVEAWLSGSLSNYGFLIKRSDTDENSILNQGSLKFYSNETHTVYRPRLEVVWKDFSYNPRTITTTTYTYTRESSSVSMSYNPVLSYTTQSFYSGSTVFPTSSYFTQSGDPNTWYSESYWFVTESIWSYTSSIALYHSSSFTTSSIIENHPYTSGSDTIYSSSILSTIVTIHDSYTGSLGSEFLPASDTNISYSIAEPGMTGSDIWTYNQAGYYSSQSFSAVTANYTYISSSLLGYATASSSTTTQMMFPIGAEDFVIYMYNFHEEYKKDSKARFRVKARDRYPRKNFVTESWSYTREEFFMPTHSYYCIRDGWDEYDWMPFSNYTQLSVDHSGSYFDLYLNGLEPEKYYRIMFKVIQNSGSVNETERIIDNNYMFRIIR